MTLTESGTIDETTDIVAARLYYEFDTSIRTIVPVSHMTVQNCSMVATMCLVLVVLPHLLPVSGSVTLLPCVCIPL